MIEAADELRGTLVQAKAMLLTCRHESVDDLIAEARERVLDRIIVRASAAIDAYDEARGDSPPIKPTRGNELAAERMQKSLVAKSC